MIITAIILNYNNYSDLKECLKSLAAQELLENQKLKIIIIDNYSSDGSTLKIQTEFPQYQYIFNAKNYGFSRGVNQGIKAAPDSDYFLLINNDAILEPLGLQKLIAAQSELTGPTIFYLTEPTKVWQAGGNFKKIKLGLKVPLKNKKLPATTSHLQAQIVDFISGCVMLISQKALEKIGLFDENFFFYGEDLDFCLRAKKHGLIIKYLPSASAWHNIQTIAKTRTNPFVLENLAKSYFLIIRKHFRFLKFYGLFLFIFIYTPWRLWQIIKGTNNLKNISAWLRGGQAGLKIKL